MEAELIIAIIAAILKYGPSAVTAIANAMEDGEITVDKIRSLTIEKEPEEYFE